MASSQTSRPITPQNPLSRMAVRRSVTVPSKLQVQPDAQRAVDIGDSRGVETIYTHPSAKVVSFTTSPVVPNRRVSEGNGAGTLSYRTSMERTVAAGPLEIYRVPGSVAFLYSGSLLHALLPRANCWCVDDVSIFILKVSINTYYRIELPGSTEDDLAQVEEFKFTLQKVLFYERTPCPFRRGFSAEEPATPSPPSRRVSRYSTEPVKKWKLDGVWKPEDDENWEPRYDRASVLSRAEGMIERGETSPTIRRDRPTSSGSRETDGNDSDGETPRPGRPSSLGGMRSITAPPKLTLVASPPSKTSSSTLSSDDAPVEEEEAHSEDEAGNEVQDQAPEADSEDAAESDYEEARQDSKTTITSADLAAPTEEHTHVLSVDLQEAQEQALLDDRAPLSAVTEGGIMSEDDIVESRIWSGISTPELSSDSEDHSWGEVITPPETLRIRKNRKMPAIESLSRASSTTRVRRSGSRESQTALTNGIVRKTCSIVLGPPAHLVSMMLKIAAKITNGAFNFTVKSPVGSPHTVPGSWYVGDEDDWDLDDYGFPIGAPGSAQKRANALRNLSID